MQLVLFVLAAAPVQFVCSLATDVEDPRRIYLRAPASWAAAKGDLSAEGKSKVVTFLYEGGAKVKSFHCRPLKGKVEDQEDLWFEVNAGGELEWRGPDFGPPLKKMVPYEPLPPPEPKEPSRSPSFARGPPLSDTKVLLEWLARKGGLLYLPVRLKQGPDRFSGRGARVGTLDVQCDGLDDRARQLCADQPSCVVWIRGEWKGGAANVFTVKQVDELLAADEPVNMSSYAWYVN